MICASRGVVLYGPGESGPLKNFLCPPEFFQARRTVCIRMLWFVVCLTSDQSCTGRGPKKNLRGSGRARPHYNDD